MIVKNVTVKWASVLEPNVKFTPRWEICVYPDDETVEEMQKAGLKLKKDKETDELFYRATSNVTRADGSKNKPPRVVDMYKKPFTELIGNGSVCNVIMTLKEITSFGDTMVKGYLNAVQVVNHIEYVGAEDFDDVPDDGEEADSEKEDF